MKFFIIGLAKFIISCIYIFTGAWLIELFYTMGKEDI